LDYVLLSLQKGDIILRLSNKYINHTNASLAAPSRISTLSAVDYRYIVASDINTYYIGTANGGTMSVISPSRPYYDTALPAQGCKSMLEVPATSYVLFGTEPLGSGMSRVDIAAGTYQPKWGGCAATEAVSRIIQITPNQIVTGFELTVRSITDGLTMLPGTSGFKGYLLIAGNPGSMEFFAHDNSTGTESTSLYKVTISGTTTTITKTEGYALLALPLHDIDFMPLFSTFLACHSTACLGLDYVQGTQLWSISTSSLAFITPTKYMIASLPLFGTFEIMGLDSRNTTTRQIYPQQLTPPPQYFSQSSLSLIQDCDYFSDGKYYLIMTRAAVRLVSRVGDPPCTSPCASCPNDSPTMCYTCVSGMFMSTLVPNTCANYQCDTSCTTCSGGTNTDCHSCPSGYQLSGPAPSSCTIICHPSCSTCTTAASTTCLTCPTNYRLAGPSPNSCTLNCDSSCSTCQDVTSTGCLSCPANYQLSVSPGPSFCVPICLSPCATCAGPTTSDCLTCRSGYILGGTAPNSCNISAATPGLTCHSSCLSCFGSAENQCTSCSGNLRLDPATSSCVDCFIFETFSAHRSVCTVAYQGTLFMDLDYLAHLGQQSSFAIYCSLFSHLCRLQSKFYP